MTKRQLQVVALLVGIPLTFLAVWLQPLIVNAYEEILTHGGVLAFVAIALNRVLAQLVLFVPGLVVGLMAPSRGISLSVAAGFCGALLYSVMLGEALQAPRHPYFPNPWSWVIGDVLLLSLSEGVAGAAGQLLRSNKSLERTRER